MPLLRVLTGQLMPCGCLVGVYETYDGRVVASIDARGFDCDHHRLRQTLSPSRAGDRRQNRGRREEGERVKG